ncbi:MAG: sensor domain-containing protein [Candidatus Latescibacterota bacterium]
MHNGIEEYLKKLKQALSGCDPATVQDALADAEEHLRTAVDQAGRNQTDLPKGEALQQIIAEYGLPEEVAAAYQTLEARMVPSLAPAGRRDDRSPLRRFFSVVLDPRAYASLLYMFFSLATGIVYFTWAVTGISLSAGFAVLIIGLPFFALFLLSIQGIALVEGRIVEALLGIRMPRRPLFSRSHLGFWNRFKALFTDKRSWTTFIYMISMLPLGIIYFTLFVTFLSVGLALMAQPITENVFDIPFFESNHTSYYLPNYLMPFVVIGGFLWIVISMHLAKALGRLHGSLAKALLVKE